MANLVDIGDVPALDVWGDTVQARVVAGANASLALVELAPGAIVPEHRHEHEQLGMCLEGSITFTVDGERRELGPGGTWRIPSNLPHDAVAGPDGAVVVDIFSPVRADWDALPRSAPGRPAGRARADPAAAASRGRDARCLEERGQRQLLARGFGRWRDRAGVADPPGRADAPARGPGRRTGSSVSFVTYARPS